LLLTLLSPGRSSPNNIQPDSRDRASVSSNLPPFAGTTSDRTGLRPGGCRIVSYHVLDPKEWNRCYSNALSQRANNFWQALYGFQYQLLPISVKECERIDTIIKLVPMKSCCTRIYSSRVLAGLVKTRGRFEGHHIAGLAVYFLAQTLLLLSRGTFSSKYQQTHFTCYVPHERIGGWQHCNQLGPPWKEARREAVGPVEDSNQLGDRLAEVGALSPSNRLYCKRSTMGRPGMAF
jgi:hypothetical protein